MERLKNELKNADAVLIGAGAGLSTAAGLTYSGERFQKYFSDFADKNGIRDMYSGGFYPFDSMEEFWAWWSRQIWYNRYQPQSTSADGVGANTPGIIKYPFWQATAQNEKAVYACINYGEADCPKEIEKQSICINEDIKKVLSALVI